MVEKAKKADHPASKKGKIWSRLFLKRAAFRFVKRSRDRLATLIGADSNKKDATRSLESADSLDSKPFVSGKGPCVAASNLVYWCSTNLFHANRQRRAPEKGSTIQYNTKQNN
mmetsp:Transcript_90/g.134  ORF Transcript_90/g.134 Transcript_90/m.134 type:complete len:113 (+) Transcript_90:937-1275(+)